MLTHYLKHIKPWLSRLSFYDRKNFKYAHPGTKSKRKYGEKIQAKLFNKKVYNYLAFFDKKLEKFIKDRGYSPIDLKVKDRWKYILKKMKEKQFYIILKEKYFIKL